MRRLALVGAVGLVACSSGTVDEASDPPPTQARRDAVGPTASSTPARNPADGQDAEAREPEQLPLECQAPLVVIEEVTRFLTVASTHATKSASCVDGPGRRVRIDEAHVCPMAPQGDRHPFAVTYRVMTYPEGGRQMCGDQCPEVQPQTSRHRIELTFRPTTGGHRLDPVERVPGLPPDATPPTKAHDGDCYGNSPAYTPATIALQ